MRIWDRYSPQGDDGLAGSFRRQRLKWPWVAVPLFLFLARPTFPLLLAGIILSLPGFALRSWAAGFIHKERTLAREGPYGMIRHPLYVGSFFVGLGLAVAGGRWWFTPLYLAVYFWIYHGTVKAENAHLGQLFGAEFEAYRARVPALFPRWRVGRRPAGGPGFRLWLYRRNREWESVLGGGLGFGMLWLKMIWVG